MNEWIFITPSYVANLLANIETEDAHYQKGGARAGLVSIARQTQIMAKWYERTEMMIGSENIKKLNNSHTVIAGVGGVGSYAAEALVRSGILNVTLIDNDDITITNINRQLHATHETIGKSKVDIMKERLLTISPNAKITAVKEFITPDNAYNLIPDSADYIVDAIDTVKGKLALIELAYKSGINIISSMGCGNKLYPEMLEITDINKTTVCPLARVIRKELKRLGVPSLNVCYSKEQPIAPLKEAEDNNKRYPPASIAFVPSAAGLIMAGFVVRDIISA